MISKCIYKVLFSRGRSIEMLETRYLVRRAKSLVDISSVELGLGLLSLRSKSLGMRSQTIPHQFDDQSEDCLTAFRRLVVEERHQSKRLIENGKIPSRSINSKKSKVWDR